MTKRNKLKVQAIIRRKMQEGINLGLALDDWYYLAIMAEIDKL